MRGGSEGKTESTLFWLYQQPWFVQEVIKTRKYRIIVPVKTDQVVSEIIYLWEHKLNYAFHNFLCLMF